MNTPKPFHTAESASHLLDWAESIICNALPMSHCSQDDWDGLVKKWRDAKNIPPSPQDFAAKRRTEIWAKEAQRGEDPHGLREKVAAILEKHHGIEAAGPPSAVSVKGGSPICSECKWTNIHLVNLGEPGNPRWVCQGCCKRAYDHLFPQLPTSPAAAEAPPGCPHAKGPGLICRTCWDFFTSQEKIPTKVVFPQAERYTEHPQHFDIKIPVVKEDPTEEWKPIETAPKIDGVRVLGTSPDMGDVFPITWSPNRPAPHWTVDSGAVVNPIAWHPIPPVPATIPAGPTEPPFPVKMEHPTTPDGKPLPRPSLIGWEGIPNEVHEAAELVRNHFARQGLRAWAFHGVINREVITDLEKQNDQLNKLLLREQHDSHRYKKHWDTTRGFLLRAVAILETILKDEFTIEGMKAEISRLVKEWGAA